MKADQCTLLQKLTQLARRPVGPADRQRAARHLADWMACQAATRRHADVGAIARALDLNELSSATPALLDPQAPVMAAVLFDGALGTMLEMDDVHRDAVLHPGPVVIPAALAAARQSGSSVSELLDAIICGYETMIRIGRSLGLGHYRYWHPTSTCGAFGAAQAAACAMQLDPERTVWAMGTAGSRTGGLWHMRHDKVPTKTWHTAQAAQSGWLAARLAAQGFAGPAALLEGEQGFFAATAHEANIEAITRESKRWLIHEVSFKPWPACRHAHPAIDALLAIEHLPAAESIRRIEVQTYAAAIDFCDQPEPATPGEARFSIQHALASILLKGRPRLAHYEQASLAIAQTSRLRQRVQLTVDDAFDRAFPAHFGARVKLDTDDGQTLSAAVSDAWGDPERPLTDADLAAKAQDLLQSAGLSTEHAQRLIEQILDLHLRPDDTAIDALAEIWQ